MNRQSTWRGSVDLPQREKFRIPFVGDASLPDERRDRSLDSSGQTSKGRRWKHEKYNSTSRIPQGVRSMLMTPVYPEAFKSDYSTDGSSYTRKIYDLEHNLIS